MRISQNCNYQADIRICFSGSVTQAVQYGVELQAVAAYLSQYQMVPFKQLQVLFNDVFQIPLSQGTQDSILNRGHGNLARFESQAKQVVLSSELVHFDESRMLDVGILKDFSGCAVHDRRYFAVAKNSIQLWSRSLR